MDLHCLAPCFALPCKPKISAVDASFSVLSVKNAFQSLSFSTNLSRNAFVEGNRFLVPVEKSSRRNVVCEAAPRKKPDSAAKRARQAEKRRLYNKAKKSEVKTRMKKVLEALDVVKKKRDAQAEEILQVEKLIGEAYSAIDKAVRSGTPAPKYRSPQKVSACKKKESCGNPPWLVYSCCCCRRVISCCGHFGVCANYIIVFSKLVSLLYDFTPVVMLT